MITAMFLFIGTTELLLIGGIALLLFGGKKLPEMMRGLGQGVKEFKKGVNDVNSAIDGEETAENGKDGKLKDDAQADAGAQGGKVNDGAKEQG